VYASRSCVTFDEVAFGFSGAGFSPWVLVLARIKPQAEACATTGIMILCAETPLEEPCQN
jgi:hypothetical protein